MTTFERVQHNWMALMKFGQRQHIEEFRESGLLFMNSDQYFSELKGDAVRADRFEGADRVIQPSEIRHITIGSDEATKIVIQSKHIVGPLRIGLGQRPCCNIFCMFAVTDPAGGTLVDQRNFQFGDSFVVVSDTQEFIDRVSSAARTAGFDYEYRLVEYYDARTYSGETGLFRKPSNFVYQNEFRLVVSPGSDGPIRLPVGSLLDITSPIYSLSEINRLVDFDVESAQQAGLSS